MSCGTDWTTFIIGLVFGLVMYRIGFNAGKEHRK